MRAVPPSALCRISASSADGILKRLRNFSAKTEKAKKRKKKKKKKRKPGHGHAAALGVLGVLFYFLFSHSGLATRKEPGQAQLKRGSGESVGVSYWDSPSLFEVLGAG